MIRGKKCANIHLIRQMKVIKKDLENTNHAIENEIQENAIAKNLQETDEAEVLVPAHQVHLAHLPHHLPAAQAQQKIQKTDLAHHLNNEIVSRK